MDVKKILENQNGQAIVEFLVFLPFMLMMYSVGISVSGAINASINQQKVTRSFFYYRNLNNSTIPRPRRDGGTEPSTAWSLFGHQIMGWAERFEGTEPVAPCFKFQLPLPEAANDTCDANYTDTTTQFIRVKTVYGICGATYTKENGYSVAFPKGSGGGQIEHCVIKN